MKMEIKLRFISFGRTLMFILPLGRVTSSSAAASAILDLRGNASRAQDKLPAQSPQKNILVREMRSTACRAPPAKPRSRVFRDSNANENKRLREG